MDDEKVYVGRRPCGCVTLLCMELCQDAGKEVAKCIRLGETVDRMTLEEMKAIPFRCTEHPRVTASALRASHQPAQAVLI